MGKCSECGKRIQYNKFKRYRGKILCYDKKTKTGCYATRLERKKAKKEAAEKKIEEDKAKVIEDIKKEQNLPDDFNPFDEAKEKSEE